MPAIEPDKIRGLTTAISYLDTTTVVAVSGVVDMLSARVLNDQLDRELAQSRKPAALIIDLSGVEFLASAGLAVLMDTKETAGDATAVIVVADGFATRRPITLTGVDHVLPVYATLVEAQEALIDD